MIRNLSKYICAKNCYNRLRFDRDITTINGAVFYSHGSIAKYIRLWCSSAVWPLCDSAVRLVLRTSRQFHANVNKYLHYSGIARRVMAAHWTAGQWAYSAAVQARVVACQVYCSNYWREGSSLEVYRSLYIWSICLLAVVSSVYFFFVVGCVAVCMLL